MGNAGGKPIDASSLQAPPPPPSFDNGGIEGFSDIETNAFVTLPRSPPPPCGNIPVVASEVFEVFIKDYVWCGVQRLDMLLSNFCVVVEKNARGLGYITADYKIWCLGLASSDRTHRIGLSMSSTLGDVLRCINSKPDMKLQLEAIVQPIKEAPSAPTITCGNANITASTVVPDFATHHAAIFDHFGQVPKLCDIPMDLMATWNQKVAFVSLLDDAVLELMSDLETPLQVHATSQPTKEAAPPSTVKASTFVDNSVANHAAITKVTSEEDNVAVEPVPGREDSVALTKKEKHVLSLDEFLLKMDNLRDKQLQSEAILLHPSKEAASPPTMPCRNVNDSSLVTVNDAAIAVIVGSDDNNQKVVAKPLVSSGQSLDLSGKYVVVKRKKKPVFTEDQSAKKKEPVITEDRSAKKKKLLVTEDRSAKRTKIAGGTLPDSDSGLKDTSQSRGPGLQHSGPYGTFQPRESEHLNPEELEYLHEGASLDTSPRRGHAYCGTFRHRYSGVWDSDACSDSDSGSRDTPRSRDSGSSDT